EDSLRLHPFFDRARQDLRVREQRSDQLRGNFLDRLVVLTRAEQDVAGEQRTLIEERDRSFILEHDVSGNFLADDLAKDAIAGHRRKFSRRRAARSDDWISSACLRIRLRARRRAWSDR